jgi:hypothetical protein
MELNHSLQSFIDSDANKVLGLTLNDLWQKVRSYQKTNRGETPTLILIHPLDYYQIERDLYKSGYPLVGSEPPKFMGIPIFRTTDTKEGEIKLGIFAQ